MKQFLDSRNNKLLAGLAGLLLVGGAAMSFQDTPYMSKLLDEQHETVDTVPSKKNGSMTMKEFDALRDNLDKTMLTVDKELKEINFEQLGANIEASMKSIDVEKMMKTVELSMKSIDMDKIMAAATASLNEVKWDKQKAEIRIEMEQAKKDMEAAKEEMKKLNTESIKKEMEAAQTELSKAKKDLLKIDMSKLMASAQKGIDKAKEQLSETKEMFNEMEKDGLVNAREGFEIEYKNKNLYINGNKQLERITNKYRKYFDGDHFKIKIDKE